ncbi:ABC transporter ATP-binding protein [Corynebacterium vitaeruminis]|uniref:ABC-type multidrug/protein/lipid transport system, ATPase component n=1 Tax=Corynebacterium vitaeruminis DSM 20294 TaxID=1224164 RepID=W5Y1H4_9CORY|nr:ABC transporter ATP-binding protein [Corynebacterium vitaeruminis]AHI22740.1 ABC-type multidrug/protein/lipid transport system, ATPase component [Corynebacterium vitaeruminis DSM 20294]
MTATIANPRQEALTFPLATAAQIGRELRTVLAGIPRARFLGALSIVMLGVGAWCSVSIPKQLGLIVDSVRGAEGASPVAVFAPILAQLLLLASASALLGAGGFYLVSRVVEQFIAALREKMVNTTLRLPTYRIEDAGTGDLISRSTDDVAELSAAVTDTIPMLTGAAFSVAATAFAILTLDIHFLVIPLVVLPLYYLAARQYLHTAPPRYAKERAAMGQRARRVLEAVRGYDTVRAYRMESQMHDRIGESSWQVVVWGMRARMTMLTLNLWTTLAEFLLLTMTLGMGFYLVRGGHLTVGEATGAALMMIRVRGPINMLMRVLDTVQSGWASLARIVGVSSAKLDSQEPAEVGEVRGEVDFDHVSFGYTEQLAVEDFSLHLDPGDTVAIVGTSGAGKSTVAALLAGLRVPTVGTVTIDGAGVDKLNDAQRRRRIAMVSQEVHVFSGALRDDLSLALPGASDQQLSAALEEVGAGEWLAALSEGLDTIVGAQGMALSPVESQQLALARMVLLDPAVIIMDEATAEAGSTGAAVLEESAMELARGRTALIVAHRLDQAEAADRVVVMGDGRILEQGTHEELLESGGSYCQLWQAWRRGRES